MKHILVIETSDDINKPAIEYRIYSTEPFRKTRITGYRHLDPMPSKRETQVHWKSIGGGDIPTHEISDYDKGWNDCVEFLEGEDND